MLPRILAAKASAIANLVGWVEQSETQHLAYV